MKRHIKQAASRPGIFSKNLAAARRAGTVADIRTARYPRIITFHGAKGGVGTTTLAAETAALLSRSGRSVVAIDSDLYRGDLHVRLDVPLGSGTSTILDLFVVAEDIDELILKSALSDCPCGAKLVPAPQLPVESTLPKRRCMSALLCALAGEFDNVIVDTPSRLDETVVSSFESTDVIALVTTPELSSIAGAKRVLQSLNDSCLSRTKMIINRTMFGDDLVSSSEIESFLGISSLSVLPEDTGTYRRLSQEGHLVTDGHTCRGDALANTVRSLLVSGALLGDRKP